MTFIEIYANLQIDNWRKMLNFNLDIAYVLMIKYENLARKHGFKSRAGKNYSLEMLVAIFKIDMFCYFDITFKKRQDSNYCPQGRSF